MSATKTAYKVYFREPALETTLTLDNGKVIRLIGDDEGLMRQMRGRIADPRIPEEVAIVLRGMRGWTVDTWPTGYEPDEEVVSVGAPGQRSHFQEAIFQEEQTDARQKAMLSRLQAITRPRGRKALESAESAVTVDEAREILGHDILEDDGDEELAAQVIILARKLTAMTAERDALALEVRALRGKLEQQARTVVPALPGPGAEGRHAPTAKDMGKGKNLRASLKDANIDPTTVGLPNEDAEGNRIEDVGTIPGATDGIARS